MDVFPKRRLYRHNRRYQQPDDNDCTQECQMTLFCHFFPPYVISALHSRTASTYLAVSTNGLAKAGAQQSTR